MRFILKAPFRVYVIILIQKHLTYNLYKSSFILKSPFSVEWNSLFSVQSSQIQKFMNSRFSLGRVNEQYQS
ncbi:unknown protein [Parachlamydia acanthamoebae UV-7]|uniref:Uncharacterized protein n=2 Tax=Parachlamydia acanthamoebae TaxID=83552 RepID=F8KV29_PARAV|nr:hypothetical protein DB43_AG00620 [Parachlamydia acanthamoebae]CCB85103.1 unknown protein [Parachlamydia acanthamoebae UV-7]